MAGSNLTASATADQYEICEGHSTTLHAIPVAGTGEYTYSWSPANLLSGTTIQNPVATPPIGTTTFTCLVSDGITDQEVNVSVTVHPNKETDIEASICENGSYNFFGQMLNAAGVYHHTLQTQHGCDSVINLHLSLNSLNETTFIVGDDENCDEYYWDPLGHEIVYTDHEDPYYNVSGTYHRTYKNQQGCDSLVTMRVDFAYTPDPTPIYPMDPDNTAPHWVVSSTEFQINSYDFQLWDNNPLCAWDTVTWEFETEVSWVLEPFGERAKCCKMYVLNSVEDTVWMRARAFNRCEPDNGISRRYWFVCSFYGIDETNAGTFRFDVAPNPNNGQMTLCFEGLAGTVNLRVYDMRGNLIDAFDTHAASRISYDMSHRADGIYFFVATNKEGVVSRKVVVRK